MGALQKYTGGIHEILPPPGIVADEPEPLSLHGLRVSEEEYWEKYYDNDRIFEWNDGVLEEKPMGDHLSYLMSDWFHSLLKEYLEANPVAKIFGTDLGFRLVLPKTTVIRRPDLSVVLNSNPVRFGLLDRSYEGTFDICFEFLSDSDRKAAERDTLEKKSEYCAGGIREYFILDRLGRGTAFYRLNSGFYSPVLPTSGGVIRSDVLSGFQFCEEHLYTLPPFTELADDPVYSPFVLKGWQEERSRAKAELEVEKKQTQKERSKAARAEKKAEAERQKAAKAEKKAEILAARLRELGIDV